MKNLNTVDSEALRQQDEKAEMLNQEVRELKDRGMDLNDEMEILKRMMERHEDLVKKNKATEKDCLVYQAVKDRLSIIEAEIEVMRQQYGFQVNELLSIDRHGTFISETSPDDVKPLIGESEERIPV
jgi:hypothetical protein